MTLTTTSSRKDYTGNGAILIFAYDFLIPANADLGVYLDGVKKTLTTDYTVSGAGLPSGGNVTFVVAPGSGVAVSIIREVAYTQSVDYVENQKFPADTHESALDRVTMLCQQLLEKIGRAATFKVQSILTSPIMADGVIGKVLRWKTTTELENIDLVGSGVISVPVSAAQGGTGADLSAGGAIGDLLIADAATTLKRIPVGGKGALLVGKPTDAVKAAWRAVGTNGQVLTADSAQSDGVKWATPLIVGPQMFDGLHARTHPDNDKAANQVAVLGLRRLVMDDGTIYDDVITPGTDAPVAVDITVAGANGLDTGSRAASTGYELWAVGKSSTKLKSDLRYVLHRAKDYFVDQSFVSSDASTGLRTLTATATDLLAEGFKVATVGKIERIDVELLRTGAISGNVWLEIRSDSAGNPSTVVLATSDKLDASKISTSAQTIAFPFRQPFTPADITTQYHMVLNADYTRSDTVFVSWRGLIAGGYPNGVAKRFNGTTWSNEPTIQDFRFKLYVTRNDTAVTMPTGYDQKALLAPWFFNNSGNTLDGVTFFNRAAFPLVNRNSGGVISTTPLLLDWSTSLPPRPVTTTIAVDDTIAANVAFGGVPNGYAITSALQSGSADGRRLGTVALAAGVLLLGRAFTEFQGLYAIVSNTGTALFYQFEWEW